MLLTKVELLAEASKRELSYSIEPLGSTCVRGWVGSRNGWKGWVDGWAGGWAESEDKRGV
jgi:hypothetical protein